MLAQMPRCSGLAAANSGQGLLQVDFRAANGSVFHPSSAAGTTVTVSGGKTTLACTNLATSMGLELAGAFNFSQGTLVSLEAGFPVAIAAKGIRLIFSSDVNASAFLNYAQVYLVAGGIQPNKRQVFTFLKTDFTINAAFSWSDVKHVQLWVDSLVATVNAADSCELYRLWTDKACKAAVVFAFDDATPTQYTEALLGTSNGGNGLPFYRMPATLFCSGGAIDTGGYMTLAQLQACYAANWDVSNQGYVEEKFSLQCAIDWAAGVATVTTPYAHGRSNGNSVTVSGSDPHELSGAKTVGGATATTFTYATALGGTGTALGWITIPLGTLANQLTNATTHRTWQIANAMPRGSQQFAYSFGQYDDAAASGLSGLGYQSARTVRRLNDATTPTSIQEALQSLFDPRSASADMMRLWCIDLTPTVSVAKVLATWAYAVARGYTLIIYGHVLTATPTLPIDYDITKFFQIVAGVKVDIDAGNAEALTMSQLAQRVLSQRYG